MMAGYEMRAQLQFCLEVGNVSGARSLFAKYCDAFFPGPNATTQNLELICRRVQFALDFVVSERPLAELIRLLHAYKLWPLFLEIFFFDTTGAPRDSIRSFQRVHKRIVLILSVVPEAPELLLQSHTLKKSAAWLYLCLVLWDDPSRLVDLFDARAVQVLISHVHTKPASGFFAVKIINELRKRNHALWPFARSLVVRALCDEGIPEMCASEIVRCGLLQGVEYLHPRARYTLNSVPDAVYDCSVSDAMLPGVSVYCF